MNRPHASRRARLHARLPLLPAFLIVAAATAAAPALAQDAEGNVISLTAGLALTRDSNVPRASSDSAARAYGTDKLSDTYLKGSVGINFDRLISQQRLQANAQIDGYKYNNYDAFDNIGYQAGVNLDWVIGRPLFGKVGARTYKYEPQIQDGQTAGGDRNKIDRQTLYVQGGFRLTPAWALVAGAEYDRRRNSLDQWKSADVDISTVEGGVRYVPLTGLDLELVYRHGKGDVKRLQTVLPNGVPLITPRNNDYTQDEILLRATYRPSEDSRLAGWIGQTRRSFDNPPGGRDFNGLTLRGDVEWALSGATTMRIFVARDIEPQDGVLVTTFAETTQFALRPRIRATGRIMLEPFYHYIDRKYQLDPGSPERKDQLNLFGLTAIYELRRSIDLYGELRRETRNSSLNQFDFRANIVTVGIRARF